MTFKLRRTLSALALLVCALALAPEAAACSCLRATPCAAFGESDAVFVATVTDITTGTVKPNPNSGEQPYEDPYARLSVVEMFKGDPGKEVRVRQGTGGGDCSFFFEKGETYLLYASYDAEDRQYPTDICTRSRPVAYAADDLDYLRGLPGSDKETRLSGTLVRLDYSDGPDKPPVMLPGIKVVVEDSQGRRSEATTDANGFYKFKGLAPGRYKVRAELPGHLSLAYGNEEVELAAGGCAVAGQKPIRLVVMKKTDGGLRIIR